MPEKEQSSRVAQAVATAMQLLEAYGPEGVTMRAIADGMGIRAPSLYKHFPDKDTLEAALVEEGFRDQARAFSAAIRDSTDPLGSLARAYRSWALARPHLYRLMTFRAIPRARLAPGVEQAAALPVLAAVGGDMDRARAAWGLAHGLTSLELSGRFPPDADIDAAWTAGIAALRPRPAGTPNLDNPHTGSSRL